MGSADFYIDYDSKVPDFTNTLKAEVEEHLCDLAGEDTDMVGAAVAVPRPAGGRNLSFTRRAWSSMLAPKISPR